MRCVVALLALSWFCGVARPQDPADLFPGAVPAASLPDGVLLTEPAAETRRPLQSNRNFPDFIGFMTNPLLGIDPRPLTQIWPVFVSSWWNPEGRLPGGNAQVYGAGINVALTDRFSVGLNQGGGAAINFNPVPGPFDRVNAYRGTRVGWLNLGGFAQYTLLERPDDQFLLTAGTRLEVPSGESSVYQGHGQPVLAPYVTFGKGWGRFHLLNTAGYAFSLGDGRDTTSSFAGNLHLDYKLGRVYPLLEFNWVAFTRDFKVDLPVDRGLANLGTFTAAGSFLTVSPGVNFVVVPDRVEVGGAYTTKIASQRGRVDLDAMILKMILRY